MTTVLFLSLSGTTSAAETLDGLKVSDLTSLEKCFDIKPYVLASKSDSLASAELVSENKINDECVRRAQTLTNGQKTLKEVSEIASLVRERVSREVSFRIYQPYVLADKSKASCGDLEMYKAFKAALSHPAEYPSKYDSLVDLALPVIAICAGNDSFMADLREDAQSPGTFLTANVCGYFKTHNISSHCK